VGERKRRADKHGAADAGTHARRCYYSLSLSLAQSRQTCARDRDREREREGVHSDDQQTLAAGERETAI
jgi:hypothetical protein